MLFLYVDIQIELLYRGFWIESTITAARKRSNATRGNGFVKPSASWSAVLTLETRYYSPKCVRLKNEDVIGSVLLVDFRKDCDQDECKHYCPPTRPLVNLEYECHFLHIKVGDVEVLWHCRLQHKFQTHHWIVHRVFAGGFTRIWDHHSCWTFWIAFTS